MKWIVPVFAYLAVGVGLFLVRHAWTALVMFHLAIVISLLLVKPNIPMKVLMTTRDIKWILISLVICASSGITLFLLWDNFGISAGLPAHMEAMGLNESTWIPFIAYFTLVNPWVEEYFWRGYLGSNTTGFAISDFLYSGFHGLILVDQVDTRLIVTTLAMLVLAGRFWRQIAWADGGLLAPILGHMAADFTILVAVYLKVSK